MKIISKISGDKLCLGCTRGREWNYTGWPKSKVPKVRAYCSASENLIRKIFHECGLSMVRGISKNYRNRCSFFPHERSFLAFFVPLLCPDHISFGLLLFGPSRYESAVKTRARACPIVPYLRWIVFLDICTGIITRFCEIVENMCTWIITRFCEIVENMCTWIITRFCEIVENWHQHVQDITSFQDVEQKLLKHFSVK